MLKARIGKLEARTGGKDDLLAFKRIIEVIHEMDPIEGFDDGYAERWARQACEDGYTVSEMAEDIQRAGDYDYGQRGSTPATAFMYVPGVGETGL